MTLEERVKLLENKVSMLNTAFVSSQINQVPITAKVDETSNKVIQLTPYTETKVGYYGETEKTFYNVPNGNVTVYGLKEYSLNRISDRLIITFDALSEQTEITISIL